MGGQLDEVGGRIESVGQLDAIVTAMRGIAAARLRQCQNRVAAIRDYADDIGVALGRVLLLTPPPERGKLPPGRAVILFGSEQGFVGNLNDRLLAAIRPDMPVCRLLLVGRRLREQAALQDMQPVWSYPMASHPDAAGIVAAAIADRLYADVLRGEIAAADMVFPMPGTNGTVTVMRRALLPFDFTRFRSPAAAQMPRTGLPPRELLERLAAEHVYAQLSEAAMLVLAGENQARMMTLAAAKENIAAMLDDLQLQQAGLRQEAITAELVELAAGSDAARSASFQPGRRS
jgi:F-type H+-transporting ATPase subunit gamma